ncbi:MAG: zinc ABC transporter substrate-binding protein [Phycisphaerae bacterium]|nr:zinc ABC transporter substrate-binding protein [Phycisphaerae bacterium]
MLRIAIAPTRSAAALAMLPLLALLTAACGRPSTGTPPTRDAGDRSSATAAQPAGRNAIITSAFPVWYFTHRISGGLIPIECPLPPGEDPSAWRPGPAILAQFQSAGLVVLNGARYEPWTHAASLPLSRTVESADPFADTLLTYRTLTHTHGSGGAHSHEGTDGHTWMDPTQAAQQAAAIAAAMARRWAEHQKSFGDNLRTLQADLASLDANLRLAADHARGAVLMSNHPAYAYLARRYALAIEPLDLPPETPPTESQLAAIDAFLAAHPATPGPRVMLFEDEPLDSTVSLLRHRWNVAVVVFDPCEAMPARPSAPDADYIARMRSNIQRLAHALRPARDNN